MSKISKCQKNWNYNFIIKWTHHRIICSRDANNPPPVWKRDSKMSVSGKKSYRDNVSTSYPSLFISYIWLIVKLIRDFLYLYIFIFFYYFFIFDLSFIICAIYNLRPLTVRVRKFSLTFTQTVVKAAQINLILRLMS